MFTLARATTGSKAELHATPIAQAQGLFEGERAALANSANLAALVYHTLPDRKSVV